MEPPLKENQQSHLNLERPQPGLNEAAQSRGLVDRRAPPESFPVAMSDLKGSKQSGNFVRLDINQEDMETKEIEAENKVDVTKLAAEHVKGPVQLTAPNYAESIMTSKFYLVTKPLTAQQVDHAEETVEPQKYETAAEAYKGVMGSYTLTMDRFHILLFLFLSGLLAGTSVDQE
jgi:hypothetical protein